MKKNAKKNFDTFILGKDKRCHISTNSDETGLNNNILVVGGSGSGKSTSIVIPILANLNHSNVMGVFTKRSIMDKMTLSLKNRGYTVSCIDFANPEKSEYGFDPLSYCKTEYDVRSLAHSVIYADVNVNTQPDPYWDNSAENILDIVLRYVWNGHFSEGNSMEAAVKLLDKLVWMYGDEKNCSSGTNLFFFDPDEKKKAKEKKERELDARYPTHREMKRLAKVDPIGDIIWQGFINLCDETGACVASSLQTPLKKVFNPEVKKILAKTEKFDFHELKKPKQALFLYVSPVSMAQHRYVSLFYRQLFKNLFEMAEDEKNYSLPYPVHVICDDFATGCKVEGFDEILSVFREKLISVTLLLQSESQLSGLYGEDAAKTIINNCDTYIYLGGMDIKTCENVSLRLNRPISDVLTMPIGAEYFFRRGQHPIVTERFNPFLEPEVRNSR